MTCSFDWEVLSSFWVRYIIYIFFLLPADTVVSMGMVQQLVSVLRTPHSDFHEHVLGALCW